MATLILSTRRAEPALDGRGFAVVYDAAPDPFPRREVPIRTTGDALAALATYKTDAAATGKQLAVVMTLAKGDRSPNGFKAANSRLYHPVNL